MVIKEECNEKGRPVEVTYKKEEIVISGDADSALLLSLSEGILARGREQNGVSKVVMEKEREREKEKEREREKEKEREREKEEEEEDEEEERTRHSRKRGRDELGTPPPPFLDFWL